MRMLWVYSLSLLCAAGCAHHALIVPVRDIHEFQVDHIRYYRIQKGDTLYSIAWQYDDDYRQLAQRNGLTPPYAIHPGKALRLTPTPHVTQYHPPSHKHRPHYIKPRFKNHILWHWPTQGQLVEGFSPLNKGINICGTPLSPIYAAAHGQVVYAGQGVRGYGQLIIIKHNDNFLSAYAYTQKILVHVGQHVRTQQKIATMGKTTSGKSMLHFEIRFNGKPINPRPLLK